MQPAVDLAARRFERGIDLDHAREIQHVEFLAAVLQDLHMLDAGVERGLVAIEIEDAAGVAVVLDAGLRHGLLEDRLGVLAELELAERVGLGALGRAVAQEFEAPRPHLRVRPEAEAQCLVALE